MFNERNQRIDEAGPAEPAGCWASMGTSSGDLFNVMETEKARSVATRREQFNANNHPNTKMLTSTISDDDRVATSSSLTSLLRGRRRIGRSTLRLTHSTLHRDSGKRDSQAVGQISSRTSPCSRIRRGIIGFKCAVAECP